MSDIENLFLEVEYKYKKVIETHNWGCIENCYEDTTVLRSIFSNTQLNSIICVWQHNVLNSQVFARSTIPFFRKCITALCSMPNSIVQYLLIKFTLYFGWWSKDHIISRWVYISVVLRELQWCTFNIYSYLCYWVTYWLTGL